MYKTWRTLITLQEPDSQSEDLCYDLRYDAHYCEA